MKKYSLYAAAAIAALFLGLFTAYAGQFAGSIFQNADGERTETNETALPGPVRISLEETKFPQPVIVDQAENRTDAESDERFYGGNFYIIGNAPKGFEDAGWILIDPGYYEEASEDNDWKESFAPPSGWITSDLEKDGIDFESLLIFNREIVFETKMKNSYSYRFIGKSIEAEEVKLKDYTDTAIIKGTLYKLKKGEVLKKTDVSLGIYDKCRH